MKTHYLLLLFLFALSAHAQTIRRVNNNPGVTGVNVYTTAQAAHDAAAANDILMIEPSATSYGNLTLTKPLKIYGNGYYLWDNQELKADQRYSFMGSVEFDTGSGGSEVYGVTCWDTNYPLVIYGVSNIKFSRNLWGIINIYNTNKLSTSNLNVTNISITQNALTGSYYNDILNTNPASGYTIANVFIANNLFNFSYSHSAKAIVAGSSSGIQNWVVLNNTFTKAHNVTLVNSVFENNVLAMGGAPSFSNVTASYNVSSGNSFTAGVGNQNSLAISGEFVGVGSGRSPDEEYLIKSGSILKTAGSGSTEVGAYGGTTPYVVSGIAPIPSIVNMTNTATGSNSVPLSVTISVKANN